MYISCICCKCYFVNKVNCSHDFRINSSVRAKVVLFLLTIFTPRIRFKSSFSNHFLVCNQPQSGIKDNKLLVCWFVLYGIQTVVDTHQFNWHHAAFYCWTSDTDSFFFFKVNTKPDKRLTHNKHAHFLPLECIVSTQSTSSVEKLINKVMSLILPKLLIYFFLNGNKGWFVFQLHCGYTVRSYLTQWRTTLFFTVSN